jgi:hypothetical protein
VLAVESEGVVQTEAGAGTVGMAVDEVVETKEACDVQAITGATGEDG